MDQTITIGTLLLASIAYHIVGVGVDYFTKKDKRLRLIILRRVILLAHALGLALTIRVVQNTLGVLAL